MGALEERIDKTQSEIHNFENLDALKDEAEKKRSELLRKKQEFLTVQDHIKEELKNTKQKYEKIQVSIPASQIEVLFKLNKLHTSLITARTTGE